MKKDMSIVKMQKDGKVYEVPAYRVASRKLHGYEIVKAEKKAEKAKNGGA